MDTHSILPPPSKRANPLPRRMKNRTPDPASTACPVAAQNGEPSLLALFLAGRPPKTLEAYRSDLDCLRAFLRKARVEEAIEALLSQGHGEAHALALRYRAALLEGGLAPATVNRRLAALRSLTQLACRLGRVSWRLSVPGVEINPYRDTRGPGKEGFHRLLGALEDRQDIKACRDKTILRLLFDLALRREEVVRLDREDIDLRRGRVAVLGKKRAQKEWLSLPGPTRSALEAWLLVECAAKWHSRTQYAARAGIEGTHEQTIRHCGLRRSRYIGLAKMHLQHLITAAW